MSDIVLSVKSPTEFAEHNPDLLLLNLAKEDDSCLREAWLTTLPGLHDSEASKCWNSISRSFRKQTHSGAWAKNIKTGKSEYYKNHRYTDGAIEAQKLGVILASSELVQYDLLKASPE